MTGGPAGAPDAAGLEHGYRRWLRLLPDLVTGHTGPSGAGVGPNDVAFLLVAALPLAASVAFAPDVPPVRRRPWLWAGAAGLGLAPLLELHWLFAWRLLRVVTPRGAPWRFSPWTG